MSVMRLHQCWANTASIAAILPGRSVLRPRSKEPATRLIEGQPVSRILEVHQNLCSTRVLEFQRMKSRDHLIRLKRFQVEERRRRVQQIETMIAEFHRMAGDLDREISHEETRSGISDPAHFAYPTYARAAGVRRDNLKRSADELNGQLVDAKDHLEAALEDLRKAESLDGREKAIDVSRVDPDFSFSLARA
jgi:flagellar FliJ protein